MYYVLIITIISPWPYTGLAGDKGARSSVCICLYDFHTWNIAGPNVLQQIHHS
jgi:hypothetical protein